MELAIIIWKGEITMQMTFRWFGEERDTVKLEDIRQIPGVSGVVPALHALPAGQVWPLEDLKALKAQIEGAGLSMECIESVNVHEDIKLGLPSREAYIENYITSIKNLAEVGAKVVCYNFMPIFDWTRTELAFRLPDGSTCLSYDGRQVEGKSPEDMFRETDENSGGYAMPGWEPERMGEIKDLFKKYQNVSAEELWANLKYFLQRLMPVCEQCGVKLAIHPDDPPWPIFGLPRIITDVNAVKRLLSMVDHPCNGLTLCTGSLGCSPQNDLEEIIRAAKGRVYFAHLRNVKQSGNWFHESAHPSACGSLDMYRIVKALQETGFDGYIRPDHGRMIWNETGRPGYGLFDRALGAAYLNGVWEAVKKSREETENDRS